MLLLDTLPIKDGRRRLDRGYTDFARLARFTAAGAFFVIRGKRGLDHYVTQSRPVDRGTGLRCDQTIQLRNYSSNGVTRRRCAGSATAMRRRSCRWFF